MKGGAGGMKKPAASVGIPWAFTLLTLAWAGGALKILPLKPLPVPASNISPALLIHAAFAGSRSATAAYAFLARSEPAEPRTLLIIEGAILVVVVLEALLALSMKYSRSLMLEVVRAAASMLAALSSRQTKPF